MASLSSSATTGSTSTVTLLTSSSPSQQLQLATEAKLRSEIRQLQQSAGRAVRRADDLEIRLQIVVEEKERVERERDSLRKVVEDVEGRLEEAEIRNKDLFRLCIHQGLLLAREPVSLTENSPLSTHPAPTTTPLSTTPTPTPSKPTKSTKPTKLATATASSIPRRSPTPTPTTKIRSRLASPSNSIKSPKQPHARLSQIQLHSSPSSNGPTPTNKATSATATAVNTSSLRLTRDNSMGSLLPGRTKSNMEISVMNNEDSLKRQPSSGAGVSPTSSAPSTSPTTAANGNGGNAKPPTVPAHFMYPTLASAFMTASSAVAAASAASPLMAKPSEVSPSMIEADTVIQNIRVKKSAEIVGASGSNGAGAGHHVLVHDGNSHKLVITNPIDVVANNESISETASPSGPILKHPCPILITPGRLRRSDAGTAVWCMEQAKLVADKVGWKEEGDDDQVKSSGVGLGDGGQGLQLEGGLAVGDDGMGVVGKEGYQDDVDVDVNNNDTTTTTTVAAPSTNFARSEFGVSTMGGLPEDEEFLEGVVGNGGGGDESGFLRNIVGIERGGYGRSGLGDSVTFVMLLGRGGAGVGVTGRVDGTLGIGGGIGIGRRMGVKGL
ncbi:hypothetical protein HDU76_002113 [Blyttiomyces sp. JEL0837]|nr:hypothetical protein HDU76_002113 [Blyttiomyces sp. JEL0837]